VPPRPGDLNVGTGAELRFQHLPGFRDSLLNRLLCIRTTIRYFSCVLF
jgi:hypothetical protein